MEEQLTYVRPNRTGNVTLEERIAFQHLYEVFIIFIYWLFCFDRIKSFYSLWNKWKVRNLLPSPANKVDIGITFPFSVSTAHRGRSLSLTDQVLVQVSFIPLLFIVLQFYSERKSINRQLKKVSRARQSAISD